MKSNKHTGNLGLDNLVAKLKKEDIHYAHIGKGLQIVYWILIPIYAFLTYMHYLESKDLLYVLGGFCTILAFLILAVFFGRYYKEFKYVDYALPTIQMLRQAANRYKPFQKKAIWVFVAMAFMDVGLSVLFFQDHMQLWQSQVIFGGAILSGVVVGLIIWYVKYKPLRDAALTLIREMEEA